MVVFRVLIGEQAASLPMDRYEAEQLLYDLGIDQPGAEYEMELIDSDYLLVLDSNFRELNRLAQRIGQMGDYERETFDAWCEARHTRGVGHCEVAWENAPTGRILTHLCTVEEALLASYNLNRAEFYPGVDSDEQLAEVALDSEEYADLPEETFALLDYAKVGARMRERDGGVFANGGYLLAEPMEGLDYPQEKPLPLFQVRFNNGQEESAWVDVPLPEADADVLINSFGPENFHGLKMDCRSSIPPLSGLVSGSDELPELCLLDKALNGMDGDETQKYRALLEAARPGTVSDALRLAGEMGDVTLEYADSAAYGLQHAAYRYSLDADCPLLDYVDLAGYGAAMLLEDGYTQTRYGAVYTEDMELGEAMAEEQAQGFGGMGGLA